MKIHKKSFDRFSLFAVLLTDNRIIPPVSPVHNFILPYQRARCVYGHSVDAPRPFLFRQPAFWWGDIPRVYSHNPLWHCKGGRVNDRKNQSIWHWKCDFGNSPALRWVLPKTFRRLQWFYRTSCMHSKRASHSGCLPLCWNGGRWPWQDRLRFLCPLLPATRFTVRCLPQ